MGIISTALSFLASFMIMITALFVIIKDWRDQVNRYYSYYALTGFGILFTMFLTYGFPESFDLALVNRVTQMSTVLFFSSIFLLSLVFPRGEKKFPFKYAFLISLPAYGVAVVLVVTDLSIADAYFVGERFVREYRDFYYVYAALALIYLLAGTINFIVKYYRTKVRIHRLQMRYVFVGASLAVLMAAVASIILPRFFQFTALYTIGPSIAAFIVTSSLFYSVISYNLMDITTAVHKTVMYAFISAVIFVPIFAITYLYNNDYFGLSVLPDHLVAAAIVGSFIAFSLFVQPFVDRVFRRKQYKFENIVDSFIRDADKLKDFSRVIERTVEILYSSLYLKRAFFLLLDDTRRNYEMIYARSREGKVEVPPLDRNANLVLWLTRNRELLSRGRIYQDDREFADIREDILEFFIEHKVRLIIPIYHEQYLLGMVCLGIKDSLASFTPDELNTLDYFRQESNEFLSTALTYQQAMEEQMVKRAIDFSGGLMASSVPGNLPILNHVKLGAFVVPRIGEGGDYFDFLKVGNEGVGILATDVSGLGVQSALYSLLMRSAFHATYTDAATTFSVMKRLNRVIYRYSAGKGNLVTGFYAYYDIKSMRLMYTNAGFPAMELFRVEKNDFDSLDTEGIPLGYDPAISYGIGRTTLMTGDIGVLYSKALINAKNQKGEAFGLVRLRRVISDNRSMHPTVIAEELKQRFNDFMGLAVPASDIMVLIIKIF